MQTLISFGTSFPNSACCCSNDCLIP